MNKKDFKTKVFSLSEQLFPMVSRLLGNRTKAEDAIQEIMLKLWSKRNDFKNHPNINGFVFLTARNYCLDILRKKIILVNDSDKVINYSRYKNYHNELEWNELNFHVETILGSLPKQQQEIFVMRDIEGYEFKEIAAALDLKVEHTRVLLSRARKYIINELENKYSYEKGIY